MFEFDPAQSDVYKTAIDKFALGERYTPHCKSLEMAVDKHVPYNSIVLLKRILPHRFILYDMHLVIIAGSRQDRFPPFCADTGGLFIWRVFENIVQGNALPYWF